MDHKNYYDILSVAPDATDDEITIAKNALAKQYHPDVNLKNGIDTTEQMQEILEAYRILSDPATRKKYDQELSGRTAVMQTFDLHHSEEAPDEGFIVYWRAAGELYDIIVESDALFRQKEDRHLLGALALRALKPIVVLKAGQIPERYWHPDIMNWLLFASYKNRNYTTPYLLTLYDEHTKKEISVIDKLRLQKQSKHYVHSVKKLLRY